MQKSGKMRWGEECVQQRRQVKGRGSREGKCIGIHTCTYHDDTTFRKAGYMREKWTICELKWCKGNVFWGEVQQKRGKGAREQKHKETWASWNMCMEERRENMQDREKLRNHEKISMLEGVLVSVSASGRWGKIDREEKHNQERKFTREWESTSNRMARHIQKTRKTCLRQMERSGESKQEREELSNQNEIVNKKATSTRARVGIKTGKFSVIQWHVSQRYGKRRVWKREKGGEGIRQLKIENQAKQGG